jgi:hypothetical protein
VHDPMGVGKRGDRPGMLSRLLETIKGVRAAIGCWRAMRGDVTAAANRSLLVTGSGIRQARTYARAVGASSSGDHHARLGQPTHQVR